MVLLVEHAGQAHEHGGYLGAAGYAAGVQLALMNKADATQGEIDAAVAELNTKAAALVTAPPPVIVKPDTTGATIQALSIGGTTATLSWTAVTGATNYNIYTGSVGGTKVASTAKTAYVLSGLESGKAYTYYLEAENAGGKTGFPNSVTFTTPDTKGPDAPTNLAYDSGSKKVTWTAAVDNVATTGYMVYVDGVLKADSVTAVEYDLTSLNLDMGVSHLIQVVAYDATGNKSPAATLALGATVIKYSVSFVADGETIHTEKVLSGGELLATSFPAVPEKPGYTGVWNVTSNITNITENKTVTAVYTANVYTVTFNANGGTPGSDSDPKDVTFGTAYGTLPTATIDDDTKLFDGWYTEEENGTLVTAGTILSIAENHTLYAHWRSKAASATPDPSVSGMNAKVTLPYASDITLTVADASTYAYQWQRDTGSGWVNLPDENTRTYTIPNSDIVIGGNGWKYRCSITNTEADKLPAIADGGEGVTLNIEKGTQSAPVGLGGQMPTGAEAADGRITGLDANKSYEYKGKDAEGGYAALTANTDLAPGFYLVRLVETEDLSASPTAEVYVPIYSAGTISVTGVTLDKSTVSLYSNRAPGSVQLTATVAPANATDKSVTWASSNVAVVTAVGGLITVVGNGSATITVTTVDGGKTATCAVTVTTYTEPVTPPSDGGNSGGSSGGTIEKNEDGSTTQTVTKPDGTITETTTKPNGDKAVVETKKDGTVIEKVVNKDGFQSEKVTQPDGSFVSTATDPSGVKTEAKADAQGETTAKVTVPRGVKNAKVTVPAKEMKPGMVAVLVNADGTEEIIKRSVAGENGVIVSLVGDATLKLVDNSKSFSDLAADHWVADAVQFAASRELFQGTGKDSFTPGGTMTRGMLVTVLARLDGQDTTGGAVWYAPGMDWAKSKGISDGGNADSNITREQLALMLYRYAGSPKAEDKDLAQFEDAKDVSDWAADAMRWAVGAGILTGKAQGTLDPNGSATRAEVAAMLERFVKAV